MIAERGVVRATGLPYAIEFVQWLTIRDGKIVRWKSYTDPSSIERAICGEGAVTGGPRRADAPSRGRSRWLDAMRRGDGEAVMAGLADDVEFVTPQNRTT